MSSINYPQNYYSRYDPEKNYQQHLFIAGRVLQAPELNEVQLSIHDRVKGVADAMFNDGAIIRDARIIVNIDTGECYGESGAIYVSGAVRGVTPRTFAIPVIGSVTVGVYLKEFVVSEVEDPELLDPVQGIRNYQEPGAMRLQQVLHWGYFGDGQPGDFFPIYDVQDGVVKTKEVPPQIDAVTQSIARYDRDSSGGFYVVNGLNVLQTADGAGGVQSYVVSSGRARVQGYAVDIVADTRLAYNAIPDLREVNAEPHMSAGPTTQRVNTDRFPVAEITEVQFTEEKTVTVTRGQVAGSSDALPDTSVLELVSVTQGATTYVIGTNVRLYQGRVDWSLSGAEPASGSTYTVTYRYIKTVVPTAGTYDEYGVDVTGAVTGSLILLTYTAKMPRVDRLCLTSAGDFIWAAGAAADYDPVPPPTPDGTLSLALVIQTWMDSRRVVQDAVRTVPMNELAAINGRIDLLSDLVARQMLIATTSVREAGAKRGMLVDPFLDDSVRDLGQTQTAAISGGFLGLPVETNASTLPGAAALPMTLDVTATVDMSQNLRTGGMKVNPYQAFPPQPASVKLTPAQDFWTETKVVNVGTVQEVQTLTNVASKTERLGNLYNWGYGTYETVVGQYSNTDTTSSSATSTRSLGSKKTGTAEFLRQIEVRVDVIGFSANEQVSSVTFDGIPVTLVAI